MTGAAFIGRREELRQLGAWSGEGPCVVLVAGVAGVGKSRLVEEFARVSGTPFVRCDLSRAVGAHELVAELCCALDAPSPGRRANHVDKLLARAAQTRGALALWLDDADGHEESLREAVPRWQLAAPTLRVVVTARARIAIAGARSIELQPLAPTEAVQLLGTLSPTRGISPARLEALAAALDGLPLALELAAARMSLLGVEGLLARLPERLDVLSASAGEHARHRSLRAALDVSWGHLRDDERSALARCAVFDGSFDLDAAEAVVGAGALERLDALRAHSWLRAVVRDEAMESARFSLLSVVRTYVGEHLRSMGDEPDAQRRHAEHYLPRGEAACGALAVDLRENLQAVARRFGAPGRSASELTLALRAALTLEAWNRLHQPAEARAAEWSSRIERATDVGVDDAVTVRALLCFAETLQLLGRVEEARGALRHAAELTRDDAPRRVSVLTSLGVLEHRVRDLVTARQCYEAALTEAKGMGDRVAEGRCRGNLGALCHDERDVDGARAHYRRALPIFRAAGEARMEGIFLCNLALLDQEGRRFDEGRSRLERASELLERTGDRRLHAIALGNLGALEHEVGALEKAEALHRRALEAQRQVGDLASELLAALRLAAVCASVGRSDEAAALIDRGAVIADGLEDPYAEALVSLARGFTERGSSAAVRARVEAARAEQAGGLSALSERSDDARWMIRLLEREEPTATLTLHREARRFRMGEGPWEDLAHFGVLWKILTALVDAHARSRGVTVRAEALIAAGWPGQRTLPEAAANRLYVALSTLRKRGLREVLLRVDEGYRLEPTLSVREES